jgi:hypothetical protein
MRKKQQGSSTDQLPVSVDLAERRIHEIRSHKVMLDRDLAELYGVRAIALRQAVSVIKIVFQMISCFN